MSIDEQIAILQAKKAGKQIQLASRQHDPRTWLDVSCNGHRFNFSNYDYRVKPEPRVIWINEHQGQTDKYDLLYSSRDEAVANTRNNSIRVAVKFVEVVK